MKIASWDLPGTSVPADVVRTRKTEVPQPGDSRFNHSLRKKFNLDDFVCVFLPLLTPTRNEVIGTLCAGYKNASRPYIYERDIQVLRSFVDFAVELLDLIKRGLIDRVTHEMNAPLSAIRNNLSRLQRSPKMPELQRTRVLQDMETGNSDILHFQVQQLEYVMAVAGAGPARRPLQIEPAKLFSATCDH